MEKQWMLRVFFLPFIPIIVGALTVKAQDRHLDTLYNYQPALTSSSDVINITGEGQFVKSNPNVGLSDKVMLYPQWQTGVVNFTDGKQLSDVELKFNLVKNELYFNNDNRFNLFADPVRSFSIFDTSDNMVKIATFKNGYPRAGRHTPNTFYLVLAQGDKVHLLKYISRQRQDRYEYNLPSKTEYTITENLYLFDVKNNTLQPAKNTGAALQKALPQYAGMVNALLREKETAKLSDTEILDLVRKINNDE